MSTPDRRLRPDAKGFSTRAIRSASHAPKLLDAGITPGLLRVPVGLEDLEALETDFSIALEAAAATLDGQPVPALGAV